MTTEFAKKYDEYRKSIEATIIDKNKVSSEKVFPGQFELKDVEEFKEDSEYYDIIDFSVYIETYKISDDHGGYTKCIIKKNDVDIASVIRNYSHFPFIMFKHSNGNRYMVCGEDYQGITVINLENGEVKSSIFDRYGLGAAFCITEFESYYDNKLVVEGCCWGCDFYKKVFNVTDIETLPYPVIHTIRDKDDDPSEDDDEE